MTHTETLQEIQNNAGNPERVYQLTKAALAQDEASSSRAAQEPVAWGIIASNTGRICQVKLDADEIEGHNPKNIVLLYTTPQQRPWVGLTPDERYECIHESVDAWDIAEAVEAKLKEKNKWMTKNYLTL